MDFDNELISFYDPLPSCILYESIYTTLRYTCMLLQYMNLAHIIYTFLMQFDWSRAGDYNCDSHLHDFDSHACTYIQVLMLLYLVMQNNLRA